MPNLVARTSTLFIAAFILFIGALNTADAGFSKQASFFGSQEIKYSNTSNLKKWNTLLVKHEEFGLEGAAAAEWNSIIENNQDLSLADKIVAVNREINRFFYTEDAAQYGKIDYWASPMEFFTKGGGDCEDFAIAKYLLLRAMGVDENNLRIVVLENAYGQGHAILIVDSEEGQMVLDNQMFQVELASNINDYRPIYSVNANNFWMHTVN